MFGAITRMIAYNIDVFRYNRSFKAGQRAFRAHMTGTSPEQARPLIGVSNEAGFKAGWEAMEAVFVAELKRRVALDMNETKTKGD